jgi:hypothetical protein
MLMEQREVRLYQALIDRRGDDLAELLADGGRYVN